MSQQLVLELSENVYEQIQKVAKISGQSPQDWAKKRLEMQLFYNLPEKEKKPTSGGIRRFFGAWSSGDPHSADNERIDADLAKEYAGTHEEGK